jgi:UDP-N-acetylmuramoyl-tripeptide--D-alanyl-D-alanine ligase
MGMMTLEQALGFVRQRIPSAQLVGDGATPVARVHTDTRTLQPGDLFVALKGERFDAHAFLAQAQASGAAAALAHGGLTEAGLPGVQVPDSLAALGALAAGWRGQFGLPLIGVTGSNGKTTVTQMVASILRAWKGDAAFATQGNFNNDIGVPLMLLRLTAAHQAAVIELGMNHPGEIATLAAMTRPTTRSASTSNSCTPCRPWQKKTAPSFTRCRPMAWPCFRRPTLTRRCGSNWRVRAAASHLVRVAMWTAHQPSGNPGIGTLP